MYLQAGGIVGKRLEGPLYYLNYCSSDFFNKTDFEQHCFTRFLFGLKSLSNLVKRG